MKNTRDIVHAIFACNDCNETWGDYVTAKVAAKTHASIKKHRVSGEIGTSVIYDGRVTPAKRRRP